MHNIKLLKEQLKTQQSTENGSAIKISNNELTKDELILVLKLLGQTSFQVKDIETLYIAIFKLQEQYKKLNNG